MPRLTWLLGRRRRWAVAIRVHTMLIPEKTTDENAEAHWQRSFELIDTAVFNSEDLVICEQIQRGLKSGANDALILGGLEQNLLHFHSTIETALS